MRAPECQLRYDLLGQEQITPLNKDEISIGRHPSCDVQVTGEAISRFHAKVVRDGPGWKVVDQNSVNGTRVNHNNVQEQRLRHLDEITLGALSLTFEIVGGPVGVIFEESAHEPLMTQFINVDEFKQLLEKGTEDALRSKTTMTRVAKTPSDPSQHQPPTTEPAPNFAWAFPVVSKAARLLMSARDLDDMLNSVLDLVFEYLPAERGCILLYDAARDEKTVRVTKTKSGVRMDRLSISSTITRQAIEQKNAVLASDTSADQDLAAQQSIILNQIRSALCAPLYNGDGNEVGGLIYVDTQNPTMPFNGEHLEVLTTLAMLSSVALEQTRLRENYLREQQIRGRLERYCPAVVDRIINSSEAGLPEEMIAEELEVSVLFLDLCSFTTLSENLTPAEVSRILNDLFGQLAQDVFRFEGTLDKFMGDGMMALFGAPLEQPDHALRAVNAALCMQQSLAGVNQMLGLDEPVQMRIGINSGVVIAGDIGSPERKDYTVIGDSVNVASRLESSVAKPGQIVIGSTTYHMLQQAIPCAALPEVQLKGRLQSVVPYLVTSLEPTAHSGRANGAGVQTPRDPLTPPV